MLQSWPGVEKLRDYNPQFPKFRRQSFNEFLPGMDIYAIDLLEVSWAGLGQASQKMLVYSPPHRITARSALCHAYLTDITEVLPSLDGLLP